MNLDLNALVVFHEVVNAESVTKAARVLGLPKSTVSRRIQHLESQVGSPLFKRGNRRIQVTDEGRRLHEHCARIASEIADAGLQTNERRASLAGKLRVSMPIDFGIGWLSRAIASFVAKYTDIELDIHVNGRWVDVSEEPYDVAIHLGRLPNTSVSFRPLTALTRGVFASPDYLAGLKTPSRRLEDLDCILTEQQLAEGVWVGSDGEPLPRRKGRVVVNNIGVARQLVTSGIGVGILPHVMCRSDVRGGRLTALPTTREIPALEASATFYSGRHLPRRVGAFLDHVSAFLIQDGLGIQDTATEPKHKPPAAVTARSALLRA